MAADWTRRWMALAGMVASWSKDRSTKTGCVIVRDDVLLSTGYNGFPRGAHDDVDTRHERPAKYKWTEHAERNAIYNAARNGVALDGAVMVLPWYPCMDCARAIVQVGIGQLVCHKPNWDDAKWGADFVAARELFGECGVKVVYVEVTPP